MRDAVDLGKVAFASAAGISAQLTQLDIALKAVIGLMTIVYLGLKICELSRRMFRKNQTKEETE